MLKRAADTTLAVAAREQSDESDFIEIWVQRMILHIEKLRGDAMMLEGVMTVVVS